MQVPGCAFPTKDIWVLELIYRAQGENSPHFWAVFLTSFVLNPAFYCDFSTSGWAETHGWSFPPVLFLSFSSPLDQNLSWALENHLQCSPLSLCSHVVQIPQFSWCLWPPQSWALTGGRSSTIPGIQSCWSHRISPGITLSASKQWQGSEKQSSGAIHENEPTTSSWALIKTGSATLFYLFLDSHPPFSA